MKKSFILILLIILILGINIVSATENNNITDAQDISPLEINDDVKLEDEILDSSSLHSIESNDENTDSISLSDDESNEVIIVNDWEELQYYCSLTDKDYTLKLKENTNYYPTDTMDSNYQIKINNNVKIIGSNGSYIGDSYPSHHLIFNGSRVISGKYISYTPIVVPDGNQMDLTLENITFKWICTYYGPDAVFIQMGGDGNYLIKNCIFNDINTNLGHSCLAWLKKGDALIENCTFVNCTTDFGCLSVYNKNSYDNARMVVKDCYFENNYARTEPGCINNCAVLTVYNTTFYKNRASVWAGAIHTHFYAVANIYDSTFIDNVAGWNGGALYTYGNLNIYNTSFIGNNCTTNNGGGAIGACKYQSAPHIYIENSLFEANNNNCWGLDELSTSGTGRGGAISLMDEGSLEVRNTIFIANAASIGTAICAVEAGSYGSPDVIIVNNTFINHTRVGDVLNVRVKGTICNISDNYYLGNSIEFSKLTLKTLSQGKDQATLQVTVKLSNPDYYDSNILEKTCYDVYVNDVYVKTVNSTKFSVDFGDLDICKVYVVPTISNRKSNEVTVTSTREYVFVSQNRGSDNNNGLTRNTPVKSIQKAINLVVNCKNIILLDGLYDEANLNIPYDLTLKGENDATLTGSTSFVISSNQFNLKNIAINNLNSNNFITQNNGNLSLTNVIITDNEVANLISGDYVTIIDSIISNNNGLILNNNFTSVENSILLNNSNLITGNYNLDYNWWGNTLENYQTKPFNGINNWLFLNVTADNTELEINQITNVNFAFYMINNNQISKYANLRDIDLMLTTINGSSVNSTSSTSKITFKLTALGNGELTAKYNNIATHIHFKFIKSNPNISINYNNILVGDDLIIKISLPNDVTGNLTVKISNQTQVKLIDSNNIVFNFTNLKAGNYNIDLNYSGDDKYLSKEIINNVVVSKHQSFTNLTLSEINVDEDLILTITTNSDATGNISLYINNKLETLTLTDAKANYTIKNITRGDYRITTIYNGDEKYLKSSDYRFIEVDNINATLSSIIEDITYGEIVNVEIFLNDNATGNVSVTIDGITNSSSVLNGRANVTLAGIDAGLKNVSIFYTGDDTYFNKTQTANFTIKKANLVFTITSSNIMIGQDAVIKIKVPAKTKGTFTIGDDIINIPLSGDITYIIPDLEIGDYEIAAFYNGNNYFTVSNSTEFSVLEYVPPQWRGDDEKIKYPTGINGEVNYLTILNSTINNLAIDSEGNIIVSTFNGIYSFKSDGTLNWVFESSDYYGNFSGIIISRDVIISPRSGDTLYLINQSSGYKYGSANIYQASSLFAPAIDSNVNLYIVSEYQYASGSYTLVKIPYRVWENGGQITVIDLGKYKPLTSPAVSDDIVIVLSEGRIRGIDTKTLSTKFILTGNYASVTPVICENIIYAILGDAIVAYDINGNQLWKTKVTDGAGDKLVLDSDNGLYHTNSKGALYRYDLITGKESLISNLKVTSDILISNSGDLFFASNNIFYRLSSNGDVLWKSSLNTNLDNLAMDKNGVIYATSKDNKLYSITQRDLKNTDISVEVNGNQVTVTLDSDATGLVNLTVNGKTYSGVISDGKCIIISSISDIKTLIVSYSGDLRFNSASKSLAMSDLVVNLDYSKNSVLSLNLASGATGNVKISVDGKSYNAKLNNGKATVNIPNLSLGSHSVTVVYSGDAKYAGFSKTASVLTPTLTGSDMATLYTSNAYYKVRLTQNSKALSGKTVTITIGSSKYNVKTDKNGYASVKINLAPKSYKVTVEYVNIKITKKLTVKSIVTAKNVNVKKSAKSLKIKVSLKKVNGKYLKGKKLTLKVNGKKITAKTNKKGVVTFTVKKSILKKLKKGKKYTYSVTYLKDSVKKTIKVK
ncbi:Ig-like domain repeat protein [Methanobrevibacter sp.]|uniref:Ig-like domain repeat protein n=1 Tax=Methanobrevibacter sp. TaxID=66852 RepID=UPI002E774DCF|nr:Ig-like domain repeat protein [Methanobrevibacter sp.]MEE1335460.1 Ig-like domain repeat protein [Methanobrevibacter sp.]